MPSGSSGASSAGRWLTGGFILKTAEDLERAKPL